MWWSRRRKRPCFHLFHRSYLSFLIMSRLTAGQMRQTVSTFVSRFWRERRCFVAAVFAGTGESRKQGAWFVSFVAGGSEGGGSCVLGVTALVIHTSTPLLYTSPGAVRGSTYPVRDLRSCPVFPCAHLFFSSTQRASCSLWRFTTPSKNLPSPCLLF